MKKRCSIFYTSLPDEWRKEQKLEWFGDNPLSSIAFERITPNGKHNWINLADNDFETLLPLIDKGVKSGKKEAAVFKMFSLGVVTARDEWVYDFDEGNLKEKIQFLIDFYNRDLKNFKGKSKDAIKDAIGNRDKREIKWTRAVINDIVRAKKYRFVADSVLQSTYRPFVRSNIYFSKELNEMQYQLPYLYKKDQSNLFITYTAGNRLDFACLATKYLPNYAIYSLDPAQCLPLYSYNPHGERHDNITDWGLQQFQSHYKDKRSTREDIFHYTYAVLHHPAYRQKYALNLKREFPRLPFYEDFRQWAAWGKELMNLHINYETAKTFKLKRVDIQTNATPRPKLKADKVNGTIALDSATVLQGVPAPAWEYKLGNRSALEWILDQYKEKKPADATIAEKFNTYALADYKEAVIDLLKRVCTVSVNTIEIIKQMPQGA